MTSGCEDNMDYDYYMAEAIKEAGKAEESGDVPIGCVIVSGNRIIGRAHNQVELLKDGTAHAEMIALTQAESYQDDWRLNDAVLFVTKEPCPMCAGAILQTRVKKVVFGAYAPRDGAAGSVINLFKNDKLGSNVECLGGVKEEECRGLLQNFFLKLRRSGKPLSA